MDRFIELDFDTKTAREVALSQARASIEAGRVVWFDIEDEDPARVRSILQEALELPIEVQSQIAAGGADTSYEQFTQCLHVGVVACRLSREGLKTSRVDIVVGERYFVTRCPGRTSFVQAMRRDWQDDFQRFARSASFLVYEVFDHLTRSYEGVQNALEIEVERLHGRFLDDSQNPAFAEVSRLSSDLLQFRRHVAPVRAMLHELGSRRSPFISEATQPFLAHMAGKLDRVLADLATDRDILSDAMNLSMSMTSYRTSRMMNRLTVVSFIFLPLTFLCGVYGMNFEKVWPAYSAEHGFGAFWVVALIIVVAVVLLARRTRML